MTSFLIFKELPLVKIKTKKFNVYSSHSGDYLGQISIGEMAGEGM